MEGPGRPKNLMQIKGEIGVSLHVYTLALYCRCCSRGGHCRCTSHTCSASTTASRGAVHLLLHVMPSPIYGYSMIDIFMKSGKILKSCYCDISLQTPLASITAPSRARAGAAAATARELSPPAPGGSAGGARPSHG
ncbi:hypothetical protein EVAR_48491_1 [Eumeta japonica]|uniref:Uncharacterized protein n=1 Tax=Eumeta variegata TaxID=151549 RepID=A0A4C1XFW7_EUMVA|nr:hypothetical protein EVAR_48491_1 [Eumeta japonica]